MVPPSKLLSEDEKDKLLQRYNISELQLPLIKSNDPMTKLFKAKKGDVIKIIRKNPTGEHIFYRRVI